MMRKIPLDELKQLRDKIADPNSDEWRLLQKSMELDGGYYWRNEFYRGTLTHTEALALFDKDIAEYDLI